MQSPEEEIQAYTRRGNCSFVLVYPAQFLNKPFFSSWSKRNLLNFEGDWFFLMSDNSILPTTRWRAADGHVQ
jgi:hypothetical protein